MTKEEMQEIATQNLYRFFDNMGIGIRECLSCIVSASDSQLHYYRWVTHRYSVKIYSDGTLIFDYCDVFEPDNLAGLILDIRENIEYLETRAKINKEQLNLIFSQFQQQKK